MFSPLNFKDMIEEYEYIKSKAKESNMSIGTYLVKIAHNNNLGMNPAIMCKLIAIRNYLNEPELQPINYNEKLKSDKREFLGTVQAQYSAYALFIEQDLHGHGNRYAHGRRLAAS